MAGRPLFSLASWVLLAGGILLQFLVVLSGGVNSSPENQIYFLQTSTRGIPNAPGDPTRWTFFALCGVDDNGHSANCRKPTPALPFDPPNSKNFGGTAGVPDQFIGAHKFFYLSRFMFAFYLIALFFAALALLTGFLALCARLGAYITAFNTLVASFFQAVAASLMTAAFVQGRDAFRSSGQTTKIGVKAFAFTWAAFACYFLSTVLYCLAGTASNRSQFDSFGYGRGGGGLFSRSRKSVRSTHSRRSNVSRGSFIDSERNRLGSRIKDDYD